MECIYIHAGALLCITSGFSGAANRSHRVCSVQSFTEEKSNDRHRSCLGTSSLGSVSHVAFGAGARDVYQAQPTSNIRSALNNRGPVQMFDIVESSVTESWCILSDFQAITLCISGTKP